MILGRFIKTDSGAHTPSEEALEVERRQRELENQLHIRKLRRDFVYARVQEMRGR